MSLARVQIEYNSEKLDEKKVYDALESKIVDFEKWNIDVSDDKIYCYNITHEYVSYHDPENQASDYIFGDIIDILLELDSECQFTGNYIDNDELYLYASTDENVYYDVEGKECPHCGCENINVDETFDNLSAEVQCSDCGEWYISKYADKNEIR